MQPWFLPKDVFLEVRRILPSAQLLKLRYYFDDFGCMRCARFDVPYGNNGFCKQCSIVVRGRIVTCLVRRFRAFGVRINQKPLAKFMAIHEKLQNR